MADYTIVVGAFQADEGAKRAVPLVKDNAASMGVRVRDAGIVERDPAGKITVTDTGDWGFVKGAAAGGLATAAAALLIGPIGWGAVAAGAIGGGVVAKVHDAKLDDHQLRALAEKAKNAGSALVLMVEPSGADRIAEMLKGAGAIATTTGLDDATVERLAEAARAQ